MKGITWTTGLVAMLLAGSTPLAARAADYFVAPSGSDSNPGSSDAPFVTAAKGISVLHAGDSVTLRAGTYRETTFILSSGTIDAPITVQAEPGAIFESPDSTGHAEAINIGSNARYIRLIGIEATGGYGEAVLVREGAQNIDIRDCRLHGNRVGLTIAGASQINVSGCSLYENIRAGLRLTGSTHDVSIVDTDAFSNSDGLGCAGEGDGFVSDDPSVSNISLTRTRSYDNSEDGYDMRGSNLVFDQIESRSHCNAFKLGNDATITNSLIIGGRVGIETTAIVKDVTYNLINNTLVGTDFPIALDAPALPVRAYTVNLFNNIVVAPDRALDYNSAVQLFEGHNIFWNGDINAPIIKVLPSRGEYTGRQLNSGEYQTATGHGLGTLSIDPQFVNPDAGNYTPDAFSAAVDRADSSVAPLVDFNGTTRPRGNGPDIGAIETANAASNHRPQANAGSLRMRVVRAGRLTLFDGSASFDPDGQSLSYLWDFGDGTSSTLKLPTHAYAAGGTFTATLTVSDGQLTSSDAVSVTALAILRPPRPTRTRPGGPTATPTAPAPTPTPTQPGSTPPPSSVPLTVSIPSSVARGGQASISVRYRLLANAATLTIDLPAELEVVSVVPGGFAQLGNRLEWASAARPTGSIKIKMRARSDATAGALVSTTVTLTESTGAVSRYSSTTRIN